MVRRELVQFILLVGSEKKNGSQGSFKYRKPRICYPLFFQWITTKKVRFHIVWAGDHSLHFQLLGHTLYNGFFWHKYFEPYWTFQIFFLKKQNFEFTLHRSYSLASHSRHDPWANKKAEIFIGGKWNLTPKSKLFPPTVLNKVLSSFVFFTILINYSPICDSSHETIKADIFIHGQRGFWFQVLSFMPLEKKVW